MRFLDFMCYPDDGGCGEIVTVSTKSIKEPWPEPVICEKCGKTMGRKYSAFVYDVVSGRAGNAKNGYSTNLIYEPGKFSRTVESD